ncbi:MAG: 3,4-dihydroxy-2-butanone-4-phosphate synthase [Desulfurococcales archaeon]|nr:3,4-dihydroxy-2-butanone-4-phosphate synthase [Desulfurococcales archaeon]
MVATRDNVVRALKLLSSGKPVFIHDSSSREDEVDMVYHASFIDFRKIALLRRLAGGLICFSMPKNVGEVLGLRYMSDILREVGYIELTGRTLSYGDPPNFSLWVNHRNALTGIRDTDRALTIRELDNVVKLVVDGMVSEARRKFINEFVAPGHVPILLGRGLKARRGHTELSLALAELAGLRPSMVITEVLDEGGAMSVSKVRELASKLGTVVIEGDEIISEWEEKNH